MARKSRKASTPSDALGQSVIDSAQKIWLAGLGAFSRARSEGDKRFEILVEQGKGLRGRARSAADEALKSVRAQADAKVEQAQGQWDRLEHVFEDRVSKSLKRLGVLTSRDVDDLARQVKDLNSSVRDLMSASGGARRASRPASPRKKAARKSA